MIASSSPADEVLDAAALRLHDAILTSTPTAPIRDLIGPLDIDAAYQVQSRVVAARVAVGARIVGAKIGLTHPAEERQFGALQPECGVILADCAFAHAEEVSLGRFIQPRAEGVVTLVLGRDLDRPDATVADVLRAVDFVLPAIEIVDSRIEAWDLTITDRIADNAVFGAVFLGTTPYSLRGLDLAGVGMSLEQDGEPASFGAGHACLGSPIAAAVRLAREVARRGTRLSAGDVVTTGALGPAVAISGPTSLRMRLDGLGEVDAVLTGEDT